MANQYNNPAPKITVECPCGNEIITTQKRIDSGRGKFCSRTCKKKYCPPPKRVKGDQKSFNHNAGWFKKGHISWTALNKGKYKLDPSKIKKGVHYSPETEFKKGIEAWNKGGKFPEYSGENNHNWVGDKVGYEAIHAWVYRNFGTPSECERCGTNEAKRFEWHNKRGDYKRDREGWERLCSKCHSKHHKNYEKAQAKWKKIHE